jgi:hypothetical protein
MGAVGIKIRWSLRFLFHFAGWFGWPVWGPQVSKAFSGLRLSVCLVRGRLRYSLITSYTLSGSGWTCFLGWGLVGCIAGLFSRVGLVVRHCSVAISTLCC